MTEGTITMSVRTCSGCAAQVDDNDAGRHQQWHDQMAKAFQALASRVSSVEGLAAAAMEEAEDAHQEAQQAANVLYQNNITV